MHQLTVLTCLHQAHKAFPASTYHSDAVTLLDDLIPNVRTKQHLWPTLYLDDRATKKWQHFVQQRKQGLPVAYILGYCYFWNLKIHLSLNTLIPRRETEHLIEILHQTLPNKKPITIVDAGTGSGAIACALAKNQPTWNLIGLDQCPKALAMAQKNSTYHQLKNITWKHSDWLTKLTQPVACIVANPPYIAPNDPHLQHGDLRFEPKQALISPEHGLADSRILIEQSTRYLLPQGYLALEHGYQQAPAIQAMLRNQGYQNITTILDFSQQPRLTYAQWPN
jgi:release factor glutamine methyltransferase